MIYRRGGNDRRARAALQQAIGETQFAVLAAQAAGAPAGTLDVLCERIREAVPGAGQSPAAFADLLAATRMIHDTAVAAAARRADSGDRAGHIEEQAEVIAALIAGSRQAA